MTKTKNAERTHNSVLLRFVTTLAFALSAVMVLTPFLATANHDTADANNDTFISVAEGQPFYGDIVHSLTTSGDTGPDDALALDRFPVADDDGDYTYERTFTIFDDIDDLTEAHVVIHGYDIDDSGEYDGDKESSIAEDVPFEATVPVACGVITMDGDDEYEADLSELNSSDVHGEVELELSGNELMVMLAVENATPEIAHAQHIHLGGSGECPPNTGGDPDYGENGNNGGDLDRFEEIRVRAYERAIDAVERIIERLEDRIEWYQEKIDELMD